MTMPFCPLDMPLDPSASERRQALVSGFGTYVADISPPGCLTAAFVRSYLPAAHIEQIVARSSAIGRCYTGRDIAASINPLRINGPGIQGYDIYPLPVDEVSFPDQAIAVVVAATAYQAEDLVEDVDVTYQELQPVTDMDAAQDTGARLVMAGTTNNVLYEHTLGSHDVDEVIFHAPVVIERVFRHARQTPCPLETRGCVANVEATGVLTIWSSTQAPHILRTAIAQALELPKQRVRVITPHVGGGFGLKVAVSTEEVVVAWLAWTLKRSVRWIEDRRENLASSGQAHENRIRVRLAATASGQLLATDVVAESDVGAYTAYPLAPGLECLGLGNFAFSPYHVPRMRATVRGVATNKCPSLPYRGVGQPTACFATERMMDLLSERVGIGRVAIRTMNFVRADTAAYESPLGGSFDPGDYAEMLQNSIQLAGLTDELTAERSDDSVTGIGFGIVNELTGPGSASYSGRGMSNVPGFDSARVTLDSDGRIMVCVSSADSGQDHEAAFRAIVTRELGVPAEMISVIEGDTGTCPPGTGSFASRGGTSHFSVVATAARDLRKQMVQIAAKILGCEPSELTQQEEGALSRGDKTLCLPDIVRAGSLQAGADSSQCLIADATWDPVATFSSGAHLAIVSVDKEDFNVTIKQYVAVEDCGTIISPDGVDAQLVGGVAMGIGNVLFEECRYDETGTLLTTSFLDYLVPLSTDMPKSLISAHTLTPSARTVLGSKGMGEGGTIGAVASVGSAIADAVQNWGVQR